jgi:hypothetical protein
MTKKVALCFSGLPNSINKNKGYWLELIDKYDVDVYASLWSDEEGLSQEGDTVSNFINVYNPIKIEVEKHEDFQNNTYRFLAEEFVSSDCFSQISTYKGSAISLDQPRISHETGRIYAMLYKIWKTNILKDSIGRKYDIVIKAETCSSYPDLNLFTEDFGHKSENCISLPYYHHRYKYNDLSKTALNHWVAFGPPSLMNYYCSAFTYLRKYYDDGIAICPAENIMTYHLERRSSIQLRLFFNQIFRKGFMIWNGDTNSFHCWGKVGKPAYIDPRSFYVRSGYLSRITADTPKQIKCNMKESLPFSNSPIEIQKESSYLKVTQGGVPTPGNTYPKIKNYNKILKKDKYDNILPVYEKIKTKTDFNIAYEI